MEHFDDAAWSFIRDDRFIQWVRNNDPETDRYWHNWMKENPGQIDNLLKAKAMVQELGNLRQPHFDDTYVAAIHAAIERDINNGATVLVLPVQRRRRWYVAAAAVIAGGLVLGGIWWGKTRKTGEMAYPVVSYMQNNRLTRINKTAGNQVAYLVDGSTVVLKAGATIRHKAFLQENKREVYLDGNAFFEIAQDANRPFYVYTPHVAIRVLGTSFNVISGKNGDVTVIVKTGKVSVYKRADPGKGEYVITPNHKASYSSLTNDLSADTLASGDYALHTAPEGNGFDFRFEETPVTKIFKTLEAAYSIKINADENVFAKCLLTTSITNETFEDKLRIICAAINATYRIEKDQVFIEGKPCS